MRTFLLLLGTAGVMGFLAWDADVARKERAAEAARASAWCAGRTAEASHRAGFWYCVKADGEILAVPRAAMEP